MSANVDVYGNARSLTAPSSPDERITEDQARDVGRVARLLTQLLRDVASLKRRWWPRRIDFEDQVVDATGTTLYRFTHRFGGRVRYWVVEWSGVDSPNLRKDETSDANVLVLSSTEAGTATIRIEEAG